MTPDLTMTGYSTAMFSTWIFVEEWRLLLDAGDGVSAGLIQKARKVQTVAVTHADRDHLAGLLQFSQLNARKGRPRVLYPADCGSFLHLQNFCEAFDPHSAGLMAWRAMRAGDTVSLAPDLRLRAIDNRHFPAQAGKAKSLSYLVTRFTRKLKPEFVHAPQAELKRLSQEHGRDYMTHATEQPLMAYSGDTPISDGAAWAGYPLLVHEATFLTPQDAASQEGRPNQHSILPDVLRMARGIRPQTLVLTHFSSRYHPDEVRHAVRQEAAALGLDFPVFVIPPGEIARNLLRREPVWPGDGARGHEHGDVTRQVSQ